MDGAKSYEEVIDFIAGGTTPQLVIAFRPSDALQGRVVELTERANAGCLSPEETSELEDCLLLEHIMVMAKARARQRTATWAVTSASDCGGLSWSGRGTAASIARDGR